MSEILVLKEIKKTFNSGIDKVEVLRGVNVFIKKGDFICIVGPSGSGKSTLLHIMGGLEHPSSGEIFFLGKHLYKNSEKELSRIRNLSIGFVFQFHHLLQDFTALENIVIPMLISGKHYRDAIQKSKELIENFNLSHRSNHKPNQLSGGERQRVAIARALSNDPEILLLDEPTGNLDEENSQIVLNTIRELTGKTIVLVTHNNEVAKLGKYVYFLSKGVLEKNEMR